MSWPYGWEEKYNLSEKIFLYEESFVTRQFFQKTEKFHFLIISNIKDEKRAKNKSSISVVLKALKINEQTSQSVKNPFHTQLNTHP